MNRGRGRWLVMMLVAGWAGGSFADDTKVPGVAPGASRVYGIEEGRISVGGYGEMLYENFSDEDESSAPSGARDRLDMLRGVFYIGTKFDDRFLFNSEIEFEHASTENDGSASLEFAYLEYHLNDAARFRGGLLLLPMGFLNEMHEPPVYLGARRPETEDTIIPTTWRESGLGIAGAFDRVSYRAMIVNGFDGVGGGPSNAEGFDDQGFHEGRQNGSAALAEDLAIAARADVDLAPGLVLGGSGYVGDSGQGNTAPGGETIDGRVNILEIHADFRWQGLQTRGLLARSTVDQAELLNAARGLIDDESIGSVLLGWYLEAGYDVLHRAETTQELIAFTRFEYLDTQHEVPSGFSRNPANERTITTIGTMWRPIDRVSVKADFQLNGNEAETGVDQFNFATGYLF